MSNPPSPPSTHSTLLPLASTSTSTSASVSFSPSSPPLSPISPSTSTATSPQRRSSRRSSRGHDELHGHVHHHGEEGHHQHEGGTKRRLSLDMSGFRMPSLSLLQVAAGGVHGLSTDHQSARHPSEGEYHSPTLEHHSPVFPSPAPVPVAVPQASTSYSALVPIPPPPGPPSTSMSHMTMAAGPSDLGKVEGDQSQQHVKQGEQQQEERKREDVLDAGPSEARKRVVEDCLALFAGKPTVEILRRSWRDDATFEDPLALATGYAQYSAQWFGLAKMFPHTIFHYDSVEMLPVDGSKPMEVRWRQRVDYKGVFGVGKTVSSLVIIELDEHDKIRSMKDCWEGKEKLGSPVCHFLPGHFFFVLSSFVSLLSIRASLPIRLADALGCFLQMLRKFNASLAPWFVHVPKK